MAGRDQQIQEHVEVVLRLRRGQMPAAHHWLKVGV